MEIKANSKKNEGQKKGKSEGGKWQTRGKKRRLNMNK
jgi:hypothetical protein